MIAMFFINRMLSNRSSSFGLFQKPRVFLEFLRVDSHLEACVGFWADHCKLFFAAQTHVSFFWDDLKFPELLDFFHQLLVDGAEARLRAGINFIQHGIFRFAFRGACPI